MDRLPHRIPRRTALAARLVTGRAGHLYGGVVDWVVLLVRFGWARARGKDPSTAA